MLQVPCNPTGDAAVRKFDAPHASQIDTARRYQVTLGTRHGDVVLEVDPAIAPVTANNFLVLACGGFYNSLTFHRVEDWVLQGGDPTGTGRGGPGYRFDDEPVRGSYERGVLAMANAGPNTNGSQFFILKSAVPLAPSYNIFGRVLSGMEAVDRMEAGDTIDSVSVDYAA